MVTRKCRVRRRGPYGPSEPWLLAMTQVWDNKASLAYYIAYYYILLLYIAYYYILRCVLLPGRWTVLV